MRKAALLTTIALFALPLLAQQTTQGGAPAISIDLGNSGPQAAANVIQIFLVFTILSLVPTIIIMGTSFTRIVIVLNFTRQAIGTQNVPSNQILIGLALIMTFYIMGPTFREIKTLSYDPMSRGEITLEQALENGTDPLKRFMLKHTREKDLGLFIYLSKTPPPASRRDVSLEVLAPAFIISELKTAFEIGFLIFIPFLIIDLVVASILLAMGMMMLPPVLISMPFKILLFIMVDGWHLLVDALVRSFN